MSAAALISIIVPLYNEGSNVVKLVEHLQRLEGFHEAILVDASDQPDSRAIVTNTLQALPKSSPNASKIGLVASNEPGRAAQMNLGAKSSDGDILVFLHCDTRLPGDAMQLIRRVIENGYAWGRFDISLESKGLIYRVIERMVNLRSRVRRIGTGDQAMFIASSLFNKCEGYPQIALMEDIAICKKLNRHSRPGLIKKAVVTSARRWQNKGALETILLMWKLRFLFWIGVDSNRLASMYENDRANDR